MKDEKFESIINILYEFDYKKNGKLMTIHFLSVCIQLLSDDLLEETQNEQN